MNAKGSEGMQASHGRPHRVGNYLNPKGERENSIPPRERLHQGYEGVTKPWSMKRGENGDGAFF